MNDIELDRHVAANFQEYKAEAKRMKDMIVWVWLELVSKEGKAFMLRMVGWMSLSCVLTVILPLTFGKITDLLDPQLRRLGTLIGLLVFYGCLLLVRQILRYYQGITREYQAGT